MTSEVDDSSRDELLFGEDGPANMARSQEFVTNNRGEVLHVRSYWPVSKTPRAVILSLHGYGAHSSRPTHKYLAAEINKADFAYITFDFHGHGYSEGIRGYVRSVDDLIDDVFCVLVALYSSETRTSTHSIFRNTSSLDLFVMGHSMGGGIALLVSNLLTHSSLGLAGPTPFFLEQQAFLEEKILLHFRGAMLMCPVIDMKASPLLRSLLVSPLAILAPLSSIPSLLFDENSMNHLTWASKRYRNYIFNDGYPANSEGLSYGGNIRFHTLSVILSLSDRVMSTMHEASFPLVILHDTKLDAVVPGAGSEMFITMASSPRKELVDIEEGLHDLLANRCDKVAEAFVRWLEKTMEEKTASLMRQDLNTSEKIL